MPGIQEIPIDVAATDASDEANRQRLLEWLSRHRITYRATAKLLKCHYNTIRNMVSGRTATSARTIMALDKLGESLAPAAPKRVRRKRKPA